MPFKRTLLLFMLILGLAACHQQASDTFVAVNSQSNDPQNPPPANVTPIIVAEAPSEEPKPNDPTPDMPNVVASPTPTLERFAPSAASPTPTIIIIVPPTSATTGDTNPTPVPTRETVVAPLSATFTPVPPSATPTQILPSNTPTATPIAIITPEAPVILQFPTFTPSPAISATPAPLATRQAGDTAPDATEESAELPDNCVYIVQSGDTLFGIALAFEVRLSALLSLNGLSDRSVIRPGDEIRIPDCEDGELVVAQPTATATASALIISTLQGTPDDVENVHVVKAGETLSGIARLYGVSMNAIVQANNLSNPNVLSIGQRLVIPAQP